MPTLLETLVAELNRTIFFREFSFARTEFDKLPGQSKEFADHVVWLDDLLIAYQLKERKSSSEATAEDERKWFDRKVLRKATKQIRDTLGYLQTIPRISVENQRGHRFELNAGAVNRILKLVLYKAADLLPEDCRRVRHHTSTTAGFIHILPWDDYLGVCGTLFTPAELVDYFQFREFVIEQAANDASLPSEPALLGQFLSELFEAPPAEHFIEYLRRLRQDPSEFQPGPLLLNLGEKIENTEGLEGELGYYRILAEFAKLNRNELKQVKIRTDLCLKAIAANEEYEPSRMLSLDNDCGFLFTAINRELIPVRVQGLKNLTLLSKHDTQVTRHVGISFARDSPDVLIDWCLLDYAWEPDPELDELLRRNYPFRPLKVTEFPKYTFDP